MVSHDDGCGVQWSCVLRLSVKACDVEVVVSFEVGLWNSPVVDVAVEGVGV